MLPLRRTLSALRSSAQQRYSRFRHRVQLLSYLGTRFYCPVCDHRFGRLKPSGEAYYLRGELVDHSTANSVCPQCGSGIRHRFIFTFLQQTYGVWPADMHILHFAPEAGFSEFFRSLRGVRYVGCDLQPCPERGLEQVDILNIPHADNTFDLIVCIHVLEHIRDDLRAIRELQRCLKPGGKLLLAVPIYGKTTFDDPALDFEQRRLMYGIGDHMRLNGLDLQAKLAAAGLQVKVYSTDDVPGDYMDHAASSPHIESDKYLFWCSKQVV